jgi:hypothetical protein
MQQDTKLHTEFHVAERFEDFQVWETRESTEKKRVLDKITGVQPVPPPSRDLPYKEYNNLPKMQTKIYTQSESWHSVTFPEPTGDFVMMLATTNR